ncbi:MAG: hypothetical protein AAFV07_18610, partial [Bacteroidota bacterium]
MESRLAQIKELIAHNKIGEAIRQLEELKVPEASMFSSRWISLQNDRANDILDDATSRRVENKIALDLLSLLKRLGDPASPTNPSSKLRLFM